MRDLRRVDDELVALDRAGRDEQVVDRGDVEVPRADPEDRLVLDHPPSDLPDVRASAAALDGRDPVAGVDARERGEVDHDEEAREDRDDRGLDAVATGHQAGCDPGDAQCDQAAARDGVEDPEQEEERRRDRRDPQGRVLLRHDAQDDRERGPGHEQRGKLVGVPDRARDAHGEVVLVGRRVEDRRDRRAGRAGEPRPSQPGDVLGLTDRRVDDQEEQHVLQVAPRRVDRAARRLGPVGAEQRETEEQDHHVGELRERLDEVGVLVVARRDRGDPGEQQQEPRDLQEAERPVAGDEQQLEERQVREQAQPDGEVDQHDGDEREPERAGDRVLRVDARDHAHQQREPEQDQVPGLVREVGDAAEPDRRAEGARSDHAGRHSAKRGHGETQRESAAGRVSSGIRTGRSV